MKKTVGLCWALAACLIAGSDPAESQVIRPVAGTWQQDHDLAHSNGDKIVRGRGNLLHAVYSSVGVVWYTVSANGVSWSNPIAISLAAGKEPAIAVDGSGAIGVVWSSNVGTEFAYKPWGNLAFWTVKTIVTRGEQPSIAAAAGRFHVTWTTGDRVEYTSFPLGLPPNNPTVEVLEATSCPNERFDRPSIALFQPDPCQTPRTPVVGYLFSRQPSFGPCVHPNAAVGPKLRRQQAPGTWPLTWSDVATDAVNFGVAEPVSLSLAADALSQDSYVAWSDSLTFGARTKLAKVRPPFAPVVHPLASARRHVHVRAANDGYLPRGRFRLTWVDANPAAPNNLFQSASATTLAGTWSTSFPVLFWSSQASLAGVGAGPGQNLGGRAQSVVWSRRLPSGSGVEQIAFYELAQPGFFSPELLVLHEAPPQPWVTPAPDRIACPPRTGGGGNPPGLFLARAQAASPDLPATTWVDFEEVGRLGEVREDGLDFETADGVVSVGWPAGSSLEGAWGTGFELAADPSDLTFSGATESFELVDGGDFDPLDPGSMVCDADSGECQPRP